jgi:hypothetical protein
MVDFMAGFNGTMMSDIITMMCFLSMGVLIGLLMIREEK